MKIIINKKKKFFDYLVLFLFFTIIAVIFLSSLINIYKNRYKISETLLSSNYKLKYEKEDASGDTDRDSDIQWANKIKKGGYILWVRHAHRNKWSESVAYLDAYAVKNNIDEARSSFSSGTCLSRPRGVEGAKILGKIISQNNIKISKIWSSPSCRSKETAIFAFGKIDRIYNCILHGTAINIRQHKKCATRMKELILNHSLPNDKNLIISGHGNTIKYFGKNFYSSNVYKDKLDLEEGGFIVLQKDLNQKDINVVYKFRKFKTFANALYQIKIN